MTSDRKTNSHFVFKQFTVYHDQCGMKVGTDSVLLGAWTETSHSTSVLDIGAGSGILALMIAQRTPHHVSIDAIEISDSDFQQATENVLRSPWSDKISVHHTSLQHYQTEKRYDLIICNPPYFQNSLLPPDDKRKQVRHTATLPYEELLDSVHRLLNATGRFSIVLPTQEGLHFQNLAEQYGLFPVRRLAFFTRESKPQERWLLEFSAEQKTTVDEKLVLYVQSDQRSMEYQRLTGEFYLLT